LIRKTIVVVLAALALGAGTASARSGVTGPAHSSSVARIAATPSVSHCGREYYKNVDGVCVHRPSSNASGATARCRDGSYSYSRHASGTCSGHGGVGTWIHHP
jgi:hypothetical protein